jgi:hypothetical protein
MPGAPHLQARSEIPQGMSLVSHTPSGIIAAFASCLRPESHRSICPQLRPCARNRRRSAAFSRAIRRMRVFLQPRGTLPPALGSAYRLYSWRTTLRTTCGLELTTSKQGEMIRTECRSASHIRQLRFKSSIGIAVASPQSPPALAQVDDFRRVLRAASRVDRSRRVEIMQTCQYLFEVAALVETPQQRISGPQFIRKSWRSALFGYGKRPPAAPFCRSPRVDRKGSRLNLPRLSGHL